MGLDAAIYSPTQNKIYGVRGGIIFRFNAVTGAVETQFRYQKGGINDGSLVEIPGNSTIYASAWRGLNEDWFVDNTQPDRDIYAINYALTTSTPLGIPAVIPPTTGAIVFRRGFGNLVTDGTNIYGIYVQEITFKVDPAAVGGIDFGGGFSGQITDMVYVPDFSVVEGPFIGYCAIGGSDVVLTDTATLSDGFTAPSTVPSPMGITYANSNDTIYVATGTNQFVKLPNPGTAYPVSNLPWCSFFSGVALANPYRLKYCNEAGNPFFGKILVPNWSDNSVSVMNLAVGCPATDTFDPPKTGFSEPIDIVFTPTKAFAVQWFGAPLKEIV